MAPGDVDAVGELARVAFADLDRRARPWREAASPTPDTHGMTVRAHLLDTDPLGQWVAEAPDGAVVGAACALVREGLWGLSLLVVDPDWQDRGLGRDLLARALATLAGARGGLIVASADPRAIRAYARAGFALVPTLSATGTVREGAVAPGPSVRAGTRDDLPLTERIDRRVRGAARGRRDLGASMDGGARLLVADGGYALVFGAKVLTVAADDPSTAAAVLRAALLTVPPGTPAEVPWMTAANPWAVDVAVAAGLDLRPAGPICTRGAVGPLTPYLPSGAFL
jgi:GNAT superfamily N-acetyltransferase